MDRKRLIFSRWLLIRSVLKNMISGINKRDTGIDFHSIPRIDWRRLTIFLPNRCCCMITAKQWRTLWKNIWLRPILIPIRYLYSHWPIRWALIVNWAVLGHIQPILCRFQILLDHLRRRLRNCSDTVDGIWSKIYFLKKGWRLTIKLEKQNYPEIFRLKSKWF